ncbi:hypothetical protein QFC21_002500 [Naganishia friedmannii]|uniref:Uncharacterized protein n=1 Tax=Naganishia friedmannii TaxID=89922 RepID=A0ACC2VV48_9TREE|nr:hypothetical protein QFC21_002500 [Naganishia friedmannii]
MSTTSAPAAATPATSTIPVLTFSPMEARKWKANLHQYDESQVNEKGQPVGSAEERSIHLGRTHTVSGLLDYLRLLGQEKQADEVRQAWIRGCRKLVEEESAVPEGLGSIPHGWPGLGSLANRLGMENSSPTYGRNLEGEDNTVGGSVSDASSPDKNRAPQSNLSVRLSIQTDVNSEVGPETRSQNGRPSADQLTDVSDSRGEQSTWAQSEKPPSRVPSAVFTQGRDTDCKSTIPISPATTQQSGEPERKA